MGVAVADYDGDGRMDIGKTNFSDDVPNLYRNNGDGSFDDRVFQSGLGANMQHVGWGIHFLDVDHDGLRDLLMVNGHVPGSRASSRQSIPSAAAAATGMSADVSRRSPPWRVLAFATRGHPRLRGGDLDNDGSLEVVVSNLGNRPSLLKNFGPRKNWLLDCVGVRANRDAIGPGERRVERAPDVSGDPGRVELHFPERFAAALRTGRSGPV